MIVKKPPVELRSKQAAEMSFNIRRIQEILDAMINCTEIDGRFPDEWIVELKERLNTICGDDEADLKQKLSQATSDIVDLTYMVVGYMQRYVGSVNCPYKYNLSGAENFEKPNECKDCESCKERFWTDLTAELLTKYDER